MDGRRLLITAGPTHEPLDPVRYLANRSSGRLGVALAAAGRDAGWDVTLLLGPTAIPVPPRVPVARFESARELEALLARHFPGCDVLLMAAAVADYRPKTSGPAKRPRGGPWMLELEPTPDLVAACAARKRPGQRIVAFALESAAELDARARRKLAEKRVDAIVANPLETLGAATIRARVITADGAIIEPPGGAVGSPLSGTDKAADASSTHVGGTASAAGLSKDAFARWLIGWLPEL